MLTTKSGRYQIFEITSFLPGKKIPKAFCDEAEAGGFWFFMPSEWTAESGWGSVVGEMQGYPMIYSMGHPTAEAALVTAEEWEAGEEERLKQWNQPIQFVDVRV